MKNHFVTCLGLLCLACSMNGQVASAQPKASSPLQQALIIAEKSFVEAAKKGDVGFFKRTLTEDFSFVGIDGQLGDRQAMVDQYSDAGQNLLPYGMKVVTAGDDAAIVTYDAVVQVPPVQDQGPPPRYQHFSTVWVKQGDAWKMKFQQTTAAHWGDW
jgi:hypothetical protein